MIEPHSLQDTVMQARFREIVRDYNIKLIIETGIDRGHSTVTLSRMAEVVISIDNNIACLEVAAKNLYEAQRGNAILVASNSPTALANLRPFIPKETLFFLDAHWQDYWPLRDEIRAITPGYGVIVLHDIVVPGHPELGFDMYNGQPLSYNYVKDVLTRWSPTHKIEYNSKADCPMPRGVAYIFPS